MKSYAYLISTFSDRNEGPEKTIVQYFQGLFYSKPYTSEYIQTEIVLWIIYTTLIGWTVLKLFSATDPYTLLYVFVCFFFSPIEF